MEKTQSKNTGILTVLAAIAIQLTLGIAYIWSVFQTGIADSIFQGDNAGAALTFSLLLATLTIGSVIGGLLAIRFTPRIVVFIGGLILSAGFLLASFVTAGNGWLLWVTYGIMGGVGMGFTYSTTIACAQKWYPHKKGLVTGVIVAALGLGGVVFTPIIEWLIDAFGGRGTLDALGGEMQTFMVLSGIFLVVCTVGSVFMKNPPAGYALNAAAPAPASVQGAASPVPAASAKTDYTPLEMLKNPRFYMIMVSFMLACMGGLMMIGFAKPIAEAKGLAETATIGVLAISLFNSLGRLIWGIVSDKIGRMNTIVILLAGSTVLSLFVTSVEGYLIYVLIALIGFFYGGLLSTYPSLTADIFGAKHMSVNYGFVLFGFGVGAVASSQIAGYYRNISGGNVSLMMPAFIIASCSALVGIVILLVLKKTAKRAAAA